MSVSLLFALRFPSSPVPTACSCAFKKQQHTMLTGMSTGRLGVGSRSGHDMLGNLDLHAFRAAVTHSGQIFLRASKSQFTAKSPGESPERRVLPVPGKVPGVKGVGNQHDVASALFCTFLVGLFFFSAPDSVLAAPFASDGLRGGETVELNAPAGIKNRLNRYGNYCGPGPDEVNPAQGCRAPLPGAPAVDKIDSACLLHDQAYCGCRATLESQGKPFPPFFFVMMALRGELPHSMGEGLVSMDEDFAGCIHQADAALTASFDRIVAEDGLPRWWSEATLAPPATEGVQGYSQACAFGLASKCFISSKWLFFRLGLAFKKALALDASLGLL